METQRQMMARLARRAAKRGAMFLDAVRPDWHKRVPITRLRLADSCNCVLGHLEGDYAVGLEHLHIYSGTRMPMSTSGVARSVVAASGELGFSQPAGVGGKAGWTVLDEAWKDEIRSRRTEDALARQRSAKALANV